MRLRAIITIDIEAADFVDAAEHQRRIEDLLQEMRAIYSNATLDFRERRQARRRPSVPPPRSATDTLSATGKLNAYVD